jgi:hypothetical protein
VAELLFSYGALQQESVERAQSGASSMAVRIAAQLASGKAAWSM